MNRHYDYKLTEFVLLPRLIVTARTCTYFDNNTSKTSLNRIINIDVGCMCFFRSYPHVLLYFFPLFLSILYHLAHSTLMIRSSSAPALIECASVCECETLLPKREGKKAFRERHRTQLSSQRGLLQLFPGLVFPVFFSARLKLYYPSEHFIVFKMQMTLEETPTSPFPSAEQRLHCSATMMLWIGSPFTDNNEIWKLRLSLRYFGCFVSKFDAAITLLVIYGWSMCLLFEQMWSC